MDSFLKFIGFFILIIQISGHPVTPRTTDGNNREGKYLLFTNAPLNQDQSILPDEALVVEGEENLEDLVDDALDEGLPVLEQPGGTILIGKPEDKDEIMETANTIVFRPVFKYSRQSVQKRRVYKDKNGNRKKAVESQNPPLYLAYDKKTGGYYPVASLNPYYNRGV